MRTDTPYRYHTRRIFLVFLTIGIALLSGCGGGGPETSKTPTVVPTKTRALVTILWGDATRAIIAPLAARSAQITLVQGSLDHQDISFVVNRRTGMESYRDAYPAPAESPVGQVEVRLRFYAEPDAQGVVVGNATALVPLGADGHISEIVTQGTIASIEIPAGQSVAIGEPKELLFQAKAQDGSILALPSEAVFFSVVTGQNILQYNAGRFEGIKAGTALVSARVDGREAVAYVDVAPPGGVTITPGSHTLTFKEFVNFTATVAGASSNTVIWAVEEGEAGGTISNGGGYQAPDRPGIYHISATNPSDPTKKAIAVVTVDAGGISVGVD